MELHELIHRRKSTRGFSTEPASAGDLQRIRNFSAACKPLYPEIRVRVEFPAPESVRCILPWKAPHFAAIFTEDTEGAMENAGFLFQQLDLFIQSLGLGACWLGMGRFHPQSSDVPPEADGLRFAIMITFGRPKGTALRSGPEEFRRKAMASITDREDPRLEPARLAPSSVNSQPWFFLHDGDDIHAYCALQPLLGQKQPLSMNRIDMGIALAHLYLSHPDSFRFFTAAQPPRRKGFAYTGSFRL